MSKRVQSLVVCLVASVAFATAGFTADTIKIGVAGPHSGDLASYGLPSVNAAKLVAEEINAAGGINGKMIELLIEDTVCKPEIATNTATKLVSDGAQMVLGGICSGATKAALPIYLDAGILVMSPSATNPPLTQSGDYPNFFRTIAPDDAQAQLDVDFAINNLGLSKIAVIHDKQDYGKGFAEFAKKFIEESGKAEVVLFEGITPNAIDYSAIVQKIKRSGADSVIYGGYHPEASKIVTTMKKKKVDAVFISDDGVQAQTFIDVAGDAAEGVYASGPKDTSTNPLAKKAIEQHKEKYGTGPGQFFDNAYSAMLAMTNAYAKAGSADLDALKKVLQSESVDTPVGSISFDERGDAIGVGFSVYQVKDGVFVEVE
ncbi:MAG: branched-chain amino acid ABC transporter substrate-binding protein [Desulfofustis sp. PB-SRB1]|jgi:branched-chain amino acid transport system substrate-binding protein|nr:branched-chain amino acid ABC transporter substrate-binding protein [Desulfofustis sp. PB-SRB1]MBM1000908.1 branched-chain amino acid ABC transporter substrate-binding protein [Desulfofustis sp. PB-SRB1]HBH29861.1 branched-chain amino acid ABC transporter substrate-binding protein [Desulfofustis sp.]HBH32463.1 branched-chain amino acid ABC transporter substrate-binding protein [Desulfofustis sp.]